MMQPCCVRTTVLASIVAFGATTAAFAQSAMRDDIAAFRTGFMTRDSSFTPEARAQAEARLRALDAVADRLTPVGLELELSRIAALADNGHSNVVGIVRAQHYNRVPIRFAVFGEDYHILRATAATADLLGAQLVAIDGQPVARLRDSSRKLVGGIASRRDRLAVSVLESPEQLHAMGLANDAARATYTLRLVDGATVTRQLVGDAPKAAAPTAFGEQWLLPGVMPQGEGWRGVLDAANAPWSLGETGTLFRWRAAPEIAAMVIELRSTSNGPASITEFLADMTAKLTSAAPRNVVLDMRFNGGGNLNTARDFMKRLPSLVPGRIFVLTSPVTFSAAISSIGYLEQAAPDRVTIVGEGVGDRLVFFAEGFRTVLPNTGAMVTYSTQRHDYNTGCKPYTDCHPPVVANPIAVPTLAPNLAAPWTFEAYRAGRDPGMDAVAAELRRH